MSDFQELTRTQRARREDILSAAIAVLHREGAAAASVDRIAKEARTSKGTVLYHFKTKEAIFEQVVASLFQKGGDSMTRRILKEETRTNMLRAYLSSNLRFIAEHTEHVSAVHRIQEYAPSRTAEPDAVAPLTRLLTSGQETGEFGAFDPEIMALVIRAVVDGASYYFTAHPEADVEHSVAEVARLFEKATAPERQES